MAGLGRTVTVTLLGDAKAFEESFLRAGDVAADSSDLIAKSVRGAAAAAAEAAAKMGASLDEQEAVAARAAVSWTEMSDEMTRAQKVAGDAAEQAARRTGASLDEQGAAYERAVAATREYEAANKEAADAADANAAKMKTAQDAMSGFQSKMSSLGKWSLVGAAAGIGFAVKDAVNLNQQMERLHTQAGASQQQVKGLTSSLLNMAGQVGETPNTLAQGMYHVVSSLNQTLPAASRASTELAVLKTASEGAKLGGADLTDVTNALDAAVVSGVKGVQNYSQAMGALNSIVGAGDMTMQDLADALGTGMLGPMRTYGMTLKDVGGALAVFGDNNIRGQVAATKLASAVRIMAAPSTEAATALAQVGIGSTELGNDIRKGGLVQALADLKAHLKASGETATEQGITITRAFGGKQATGVELLLAQLDRLRAKTDQVGSGADKFAGDYASYSQTLAAQWDKMRAGLAALADKMGTVLIPVLQAVVGWLDKHRTAVVVLAGVIAGVLSTAIAMFAYEKAAAFVSAVKGMVVWLGTLGTTSEETAGIVDTALGSTGIGLIIVALGVAVVELGKHWGTVMNGMKSAVNVMVEAAESALNGLINALNSAIGVFNSTIGQITGSIGAIGHVHVGGVFSSGSGSPMDYAPGAVHVHNWTGAENATAGAIYRELRAAGMSKAGAAGIIGNAMQETSLNAGDNGPGGQGLFEWDTSAGRAGLMSYAQRQGIPWNLPGAQIGYLLQQLSTNPQYAGLLHTLRTTSDPTAAAKLFEQVFERAGTPMMAHREEYAQDVFSGLTGITTVGGGRGPRYPRINVRNLAAGTATIPAAVAAMLHTANALVGTAYTWGGGHNGWDPVAELKRIGVDCSGFVSAVLHAGGVRMPGPQTTAGLPDYLKAGVGSAVTVWDRPFGPQAHTLIDILGKWFESGGSSQFNPRGGVSQISAAAARGELAGQGFHPFHPLMTGNAYAGSGTGTLLASIDKTAESMFKSLRDDIQNGTPRTLEDLLGATTRGIGGRLNMDYATGRMGAATRLLSRSTGGSEQALVYNTLVGELKSTHQKALEQLAGKLESTHAQALRELTAEIYAVHASDMATMTTDVVATMQAASQKMVDAMDAAATAIKDASQIMADAANAQSQAVSDQSKILTDTLGERGLYGLHLLAQQQQVALDQLTAAWDVKSASATSKVDAVQKRTDAAVAVAQSRLDNVTKRQDHAIQAAQQRVDNAATGTKAAQEAAAAALAIAQAHAQQVEQKAQNALDQAQAQAGVQLANAQATLQQVKSQAQVAEAQQQAIVQKTEALAQTQFAGSGLTVNIVGITPTDAAAVADAVGWKIRSMVPV